MPKPNEAKFAYEGLDRVIHERARLSVLTALITTPTGLSFVDLKAACALTDGNLARHLQVLEAEGMIKIIKDDSENRTQTLARISAAGRKRFVEYLGILEQVIQDAARAAKQEQKLLNKLKPLKA